ncbi:glycoside hydrolase family 3 N-terminal domain-containing protein [Propionicimonas sp.]|uniref:glycoside hydrolase family 3 N-terminal domain-containing protein n=1 Tax=Propionicimonas sp. TaxID=1955623 RepID=UPI0025D0D50E|nr:glycoside hydrolase family 3 N-terminal domain-containing protein [Propionicimonas sp.]
MPTATYLDPHASVAARTADLLARMTPEEKVGQMLMLDARGDLHEAITERHAGSILHTSPELMSQAHQLASQTRLHIPLLVADDGIHGHSFWPGATIFGTQLAMACSWNPSLIERAARVTAVEMAATGMHWTFSPVLCITRDLRWGRVNETFGEDPYLIGELGSAMIRGYQGTGLADPDSVLACAKHFAGYSETQGGRDASEADLSQRKLRSWFLPPFERAASEQVGTFMLGYQSMDGVPITANRWLINDVLKGEWGYDGLLVTDWDNVGRMVWEQQVCANITEASTLAVRAGNDVIMTTPTFYEGALAALAEGRITEAEVDAAVSRILRLKFRLGLFEDPRYPDLVRQSRIASPEHRAVNLELARRSLVLLTNDGTLPVAGVLRAEETGRAVCAETRKIAVIGPNADDPQAMLGDWAGDSGQVTWMPGGHPRSSIQTVRDGFIQVAPQNWQVTYAKGAEIGTLAPDPEGTHFPDGQPRPDVFVAAQSDSALLAAATAAAASADLAVVVVGDTVALTGEGRSTATLELQGGQIALLEAIASTGTPMVVVLVQSKPSTLPPAALDAAAIIAAFNPGMRGGQAIAELILGLIEPTGRLPITYARHVGQQPVYYNQIRGQHGDRYADLTQRPLFAFGEGLAYSEVEYGELQIQTSDYAAADRVRASIQLRNLGQRPATETVQAYVSDRVTSAAWADQELKAFTQVRLAPGETVTATIEFDAAACSIVTAAGQRVVEPGKFELRVGPSSDPTRQVRASFRIN